MLYMIYMVKTNKEKPMSTYRLRLQAALLRGSIVKNRPRRTFYDICEAIAYVAFASGWLVAILTHL